MLFSLADLESARNRLEVLAPGWKANKSAVALADRPAIVRLKDEEIKFWRRQVLRFHKVVNHSVDNH